MPKNKTYGGRSYRTQKELEILKAEKLEYDRNYRNKNKELIKKKKAEYFKKTYDKEKAAIKRKINMHKHIEYCRNPEYRKWKKKYDNKYRAKKYYGEFNNCINLLCELENEIRKIVPDKYDRLKMRGLLERMRDRKLNKKMRITMC